MPQDGYRGQRTISGVGHCHPLCLEQGLLFAAAYTKLAGPRVSGDSLVSTPFAHRNDGITDMWALGI